MKTRLYYCDFTNRFLIKHKNFYITYTDDGDGYGPYIQDAFYKYGMKLTYIGLI